jgi:hypothetical protein
MAFYQLRARHRSTDRHQHDRQELPSVTLLKHQLITRPQLRRVEPEERFRL